MLFHTIKTNIAFSHVLIDEVGENENHALASLMELISLSVETYENQNVPELKEC
ncbi:MAG: hypothetical protein ACK481_02985 [Candidatus Melainabacteria bacterium]